MTESWRRWPDVLIDFGHQLYVPVLRQRAEEPSEVAIEHGRRRRHDRLVRTSSPAAGAPSAFALVMPTEVAVFGEDAAVADPAAHPPDYVALVHRDAGE